MDTTDHTTGRNTPFDTALLRRRRAAGRCGPVFLAEHAAAELLARLPQARQRLAAATRDAPPRAAVCGPAFLVEALAAALPDAFVVQAHWLAPCGASRHHPQLVMDHERLPLADAGLDLALVLFDFAFVNDLPRALHQWRRVLRPGGVLLAALPGGDTLHELRSAWTRAEHDLARMRGGSDSTGNDDTTADSSAETASRTASGGSLPPSPGWRVAPFVDVRQLARLAGMAGFTAVVTDIERLRVRYPDALALMQELKEAGWNNPLARRPRRPVTRTLLARAAAICELRHGDADGRLPVTFELLYLSAATPATGQAPHGACPA